MKLTQSERIALGLGRNADNNAPMYRDELINVRGGLNLSQECLALTLGVTRYWITECESSENNKQLSKGHSLALRLLMDMDKEQRDKWIVFPEKSKKGCKRSSKKERVAKKEDDLFKESGYVL